MKPIPRVPLFLLAFALASSTEVLAHQGHDHEGVSLTEGPAALGAPIHLPKATQFLMEVRTTPVVEATLPRRIKTLGRIVVPPNRQAQVRAPFSGLIVYDAAIETPEPGTRVESGAVLALLEQNIDAPQRVSFAAEIANTRTELELAKEHSEHAQIEMERVQKLGEAASERRLVEAQAEVSHAELRVAGLQETLAQLNSAQSATSSNPKLVPIKAPVGGVIASSQITAGEFVDPQKLLLEIVDLDRVWAVADIYERDLALMEDAARAVVRSDSYELDFEGQFHHLSPRLDADSRTVEAYFEVPNPDHKLREGMFVSILIETDELVSGLLASKEAVVEQRGMDVAYVKTGAETFEAREVHIAGRWGDDVMIEEGLAPGEVVVTQGIYQVRASATAGGASQPQEESALEHGHEH